MPRVGLKPLDWPKLAAVSFSGLLGSTLAVTRGGHTVTLQQEPEHKPVRDKE